MNILFVCTANKLRSPTAEAVFSGRPDITVRSAGLDSEAPCLLDAGLIPWADKIYAMETHHREKIRKKFRKVLGTKPVITLGIPDEYEFMQPEFIALLKEHLPVYADEGRLRRLSRNGDHHCRGRASCAPPDDYNLSIMS